MPLKGVPAEDISEMSHSANHKKRVAKHGRKTAHAMEVAAAMATRDKKKGLKRTAKGKGKRKSGLKRVRRLG